MRWQWWQYDWIDWIDLLKIIYIHSHFTSVVAATGAIGDDAAVAVSAADATVAADAAITFSVDSSHCDAVDAFDSCFVFLKQPHNERKWKILLAN